MTDMGFVLIFLLSSLRENPDLTRDDEAIVYATISVIMKDENAAMTIPCRDTESTPSSSPLPFAGED